MQPPRPLGLAPLLHWQFHFLALPFSQESHQVLDFGNGLHFQIHAGESGTAGGGGLSGGSDSWIRKC